MAFVAAASTAAGGDTPMTVMGKRPAVTGAAADLKEMRASNVMPLLMRDDEAYWASAVVSSSSAYCSGMWHKMEASVAALISVALQQQCHVLALQ